MRSGTPSLAEAPQRLRAMAEAFEQGLGLTEVATLFRLPIRDLQRIVVAKRSLCRESKVISSEVMAKAAVLIRQRRTFKYAADMLDVNLSSLVATMQKNGLTAGNLRPPDTSRLERLKEAVRLYQAGEPVEQISFRTEISQRAIYAHFKRKGVPLRQPRHPENRHKLLREGRFSEPASGGNSRA